MEHNIISFYLPTATVEYIRGIGQQTVADSFDSDSSFVSAKEHAILISAQIEGVKKSFQHSFLQNGDGNRYTFN
jgi:hypothetical protein